MTSLRSLSLTGNSISDVAPLAALHDIGILRLGGNDIATLEPFVDDVDFGHGGELWLGGNPLTCEAEASHLEVLASRGLVVWGLCE
jgi:Leucine-rich repeat (LRR) protein